MSNLKITIFIICIIIFTFINFYFNRDKSILTLSVVQYFGSWFIILVQSYVGYLRNPKPLHKSINIYGKFTVALVFIMSPIWMPFWFLLWLVSQILINLGNFGYWIERKL